MNKIAKKSRSQLKMFTLEEFVAADSEVRMIDQFVDSLDLVDLRFEDFNNNTGRPSYLRDILVKLFLYGDMNGVRTRRKLEKCCRANDSTHKASQNYNFLGFSLSNTARVNILNH